MDTHGWNRNVHTVLAKEAAVICPKCGTKEEKPAAVCENCGYNMNDFRKSLGLPPVEGEKKDA